MKRAKGFLALFLLITAIVTMSMNAFAAPKLNKSAVTLVKGRTVQLKVSGAAGKTKWTSSKKAVASVSSKGLVKARKKGTAIISATVDRKTLRCRIRVEDPKISKTFLTIEEGGKAALKIKGTTQKIKWVSRNTRVAKVSSKGAVQAKAAGSTKIIAYAGGKKFVCKVTVTAKELAADSSSENSGSDGNSGGGSAGDSGDASSDAGSSGAGMVWIPRTGSKYHSYPGCSGMRSPSCVSVGEAIARGYSACSKCW